MARRPVLEQRPPFVDQESRSLEQLLATLERDLRERLRECRRRDRGVVLYLDGSLDTLARSNHPSDAQSRKSIDLRQPACHEDPRAAATERGSLLGRSLRPAIDLVREDPC